ncbi:30S ribosomal protein S21 [bacterium]|jgi:small subunit ribosomal protein S21|nr:30S ribosomal protein S21 [bacterium]NBW56362.1 30S ribosomal protein S21 [bacterium]NBX72205.1 30S ribosomal protein S21 [bacterium]
MPTIKIKENDSYPDGLIRKFKKAVERSGLLAELKNRQYYVKPSKIKQREKAAAVKRLRKKLSRDFTGTASKGRKRSTSATNSAKPRDHG